MATLRGGFFVWGNTMPAIPPLETLGRRIMICGPSNSGKSTLAVALAAKLNIPAVHLDQFRHLPNTDWQQRPDAEFAVLHDVAITGDAWILDGNYSTLMPQRLARATAIILLSDNVVANLARYARRTLFEKQRPGALDGAKDSLKWDMVRWIWNSATKHIHRYRRDLPKSGLPFLDVGSMAELNRLYATWGLSR